MAERVVEQLTGRMDVFGGITVWTKKHPIPQERVAEVLQRSLMQWNNDKVHGVWIKVEKEDSFWIPILVEHGFDFHHARPGYSMLTKWLPKNKPNTLPKDAFTTIGVGGIVENKNGQILLMKEKRGYYLGWKFPGGMMDPGENVFETAKREVFEETGVETQFVTVLTMRHSISLNFADMYFVCAMKPVDESRTTPKPCPRETSACQWMTREEIATLPEEEFHAFNRQLLAIYDRWRVSDRKGFHVTGTEFMGRQWSVYATD